MGGGADSYFALKRVITLDITGLAKTVGHIESSECNKEGNVAVGEGGQVFYNHLAIARI